MSGFRKATKTAAKLRLALIGPSGSGKTYTALSVAQHLGGGVAVIDTERGSASKYADVFEFDTMGLETFSPEVYVKAIQEAGKLGYGTLVIDSLSHAWVGRGGALEIHDNAVARQRTQNSYTAWREVTPLHNAMVDAILQCPCHVIATMRAKTEYVQEKDDRGKTTVRKVGMAPVQRDGLEYEFDVVGDLDWEHNFIVSKTRCPALSGAVMKKPGEELARTLSAWLGGPAVPPGQASQARPPSRVETAKSGHDNWPADGAALHARLAEYERKLAAQGLCQAGELLDAVAEAGAKEGWQPDVAGWQIGQAVMTLTAEVVKAFEAKRRAIKNGQKQAAAV